MSETTQVVEVEAAVASPAVEEEVAGAKESIYAAVDAFVKNKTGKRIGKSGGQEIFNLVVGQIFANAAKEGQLRFNGGFGSLHLKTYQPGTRRLPSGATAEFGERDKIRYEEGVVVKMLIKNGGNLAEAMQVRGTRESKPTVAKVEQAAPAVLAPSEADPQAEVDLS